MSTSDDLTYLRRRDLGNLLLVLALLVCLFGVAFAWYASALLPDEWDGINLMSVPLRVLQFALACAIPVSAGLAGFWSRRLQRGEIGPRLPLRALGASVAAFVGWILVFIDWPTLWPLLLLVPLFVIGVLGGAAGLVALQRRLAARRSDR